MYIKICGLTKLEQAQAIAQMGVDAIGFICVPASLRYISASAIGQITANLIGAKPENMEIALNPISIFSNPNLGSNLDLIGVFVNASVNQICETFAIGGLNAVQLHGDESPEFCIDLRSQLAKINSRIKLIKAFRIKNQAGLAQAQLFSPVVDALLLDAYDPQMSGGTGKTLDWRILRDFAPDCDWWLAGGLSPDNVEQAIALTSPNGLDVSSGVEIAAGDKDLDKVRKFIAIARS